MLAPVPPMAGPTAGLASLVLSVSNRVSLSLQVASTDTLAPLGTSLETVAGMTVATPEIFKSCWTSLGMGGRMAGFFCLTQAYINLSNAPKPYYQTYRQSKH